MHRTIVNILRVLVNKNICTYRIALNAVQNDRRKCTFCMNHLLIQEGSVQGMCKRYKYSKRKGIQEEESTDEDGDDEIELPSEMQKSKFISKKVDSLRLDAILKNGLGVGRNKVDEAFYNSNIRLNERKVVKKSIPVTVGDKIDLVRGRDMNNPRLLNVARVVVIKAKPEENFIAIKLARDTSLTIEDYKDPWKGTTS